MTQSATMDVPRLAPDLAGVRMTPEEFDAAEEFDADYNYELVEGVLIVSPFSSRAERSPNELLGHWLLLHQSRHPEGQRLIATLTEDYIPVRKGRRRADRVIWTVVGASRPDPAVAVPTIAVEFVSAGKVAWRRDYLEKRDDYFEAGLLEYWVVDRFARTLTAYTSPSRKSAERVTGEGDVFRTDLLPGFELPLAELLAAADRWSLPA